MIRLSTALAVAGVIGLALSPPAVASNAPAWVLEASRVPTPGDVGDAPAVDLLRDCRIDVGADGRLVTVERRVVRILTPEGRSEAAEGVAYIQGSAKVDLRGWAIRPSGVVREYGKKETTDGAYGDSELYSEYRERALDLSGEAEVGAVFGFESTAEERTIFFQLDPHFQSDLPAVTSTIRVSLPPRWDLRAAMLRHAAVDPVIAADGSKVWTLQGLRHVRPEAYGPVWYTRIPRLAINLLPPQGSFRRVEQWSDVSRWLHEIAEPQSALDDRLVQKAKAVTSGKEDEWERIRAVSEFVQSLRYESIETGLARGEGYKPHAASEVLVKSCGDCKDKANLQLTLLKALGIRAYLLSIYYGDRDYVHEDWAAPMQFNHCILAIAVSDRIASPLVIDVPGLGRLLPFDPTDPTTPLGGLPLKEQGSLALICAPSDGALVRMPLLPADANLIRRDAVGTMGPDGSMKVTVTLLATGQSASSYRSRYHYTTPAQYRTAMETWLTETLPGASLTRIALRDSTEPNEYRLDVDLIVPRAVRSMSGGLLAFQPSFLPPLVPWFDEGRTRQSPVRVEPGRMVDVMEFRIPDGYRFESIPDSARTTSSFGTLRTRFDTQESTIRYTQEVTLQGGLVPPEEAGQLKEFLARARGAGRDYVVAVPH